MWVARAESVLMPLESKIVPRVLDLSPRGIEYRGPAVRLFSMDIQTYRQRRKEQEKTARKYRELCWECRQPTVGCYCSTIKMFDPKIKFVILIHPVEERRRIATGRMTHQCLINSELIAGQDYSNNQRVNDIIDNPNYSSVILYPGRNSVNLTVDPDLQSPTANRIFLPSKTPVIFVIDGTWATAGKMVRQSSNLSHLPRICFTPPAPSQFRVRKQPKPECYSTIEAVHHTIELLGDKVGFPIQDRKHDNLLEVFNKLVETQIQFVQEAYDNPRSTSYRRPKNRVYDARLG